MTVSVCVAGATGWTGRAVAEAVLGADDLQLRSAVGRAHAGSDLGVAWGGHRRTASRSPVPWPTRWTGWTSSWTTPRTTPSSGTCSPPSSEACTSSSGPPA